jgi:hypothetical protein
VTPAYSPDARRAVSPQITMGLVDARWPLSPREADSPAWESLSDEAKDPAMWKRLHIPGRAFGGGLNAQQVERAVCDALARADGPNVRFRLEGPLAFQAISSGAASWLRF